MAREKAAAKQSDVIVIPPGPGGSGNKYIVRRLSDGYQKAVLATALDAKDQVEHLVARLEAGE